MENCHSSKWISNLWQRRVVISYSLKLTSLISCSTETLINRPNSLSLKVKNTKAKPQMQCRSYLRVEYSHSTA